MNKLAQYQIIHELLTPLNTIIAMNTNLLNSQYSSVDSKI